MYTKSPRHRPTPSPKAIGRARRDVMPTATQTAPATSGNHRSKAVSKTPTTTPRTDDQTAFSMWWLGLVRVLDVAIPHCRREGQSKKPPVVERQDEQPQLGKRVSPYSLAVSASAALRATTVVRNCHGVRGEFVEGQPPGTDRAHPGCVQLERVWSH